MDKEIETIVKNLLKIYFSEYVNEHTTQPNWDFQCNSIAEKRVIGSQENLNKIRDWVCGKSDNK